MANTMSFNVLRLGVESKRQVKSYKKYTEAIMREVTIKNLNCSGNLHDNVN